MTAGLELLPILDFVPSGCCIIGPNAKVIFWNRTLEAWTQRAAVDMTGRSLFEAFPLLAEPRFKERILGVAKTGAPAVFSSALNPQFFPSTRPGGRPRIQQTSLIRLNADTEGQPRVLITVTDVTDQYERGEKYRLARADAVEEARVRKESEDRLRLILLNLPVIVFALDEQFRLVFWNREAERVSGYSAEEVFNSPGFFHALIADESKRDDFREAFQARAGEFFDWESDFTCKDGSIRTVALSSVAKHLPIPGWPGGWGTGVDVTERKMAEDTLRSAQKLESLGILASGIAHDFNNLFGSVLGNLELLRSKWPESSGAESHLATIEREIHRASELSMKMLAFSGKAPFALKAVSLNHLVEGLKSYFSNSLFSRIEWGFDFQEGLPPVAGDATQIEQVLLALITNAGEAIGDQKGRIEISSRSATLGENEIRRDFPGQLLVPGQYVVLRISDTGCGIRPENLLKIFDPFYSTKFAGRGLSLAVAQGILRGHRAGIAVTTSWGRGTEFRLYFPEAIPVPSTAPAVSEGATPRQGLILLVDDDHALRESTAEVLTMYGYHVIETQDGAEAVAKYRELGSQIALVLMDLTMPRMDGREAFLAIRKLDPDVRIILCSGYSEHDVSRQFLGKGMAAFLQKPYRMFQLRALVEQYAKPA